MQMLRRQCDVEKAGLASEELGLDAAALGQRLLAAAQAAAAIHMAEQARRSLLSTSSTSKMLRVDGCLTSVHEGGER